MAYEAGADIITASIGGASGWSEDPWAVAVSRIVAKGVPCTISAGNDGDYGLFYASTAANGKDITAIASIDNAVSPALLSNASYTVAGSNQSFGYTPGTPTAWAGVTLPLWSVNYNTTDPANACDPLPDDTPDLAGYIVLVRRGTCTFAQKLENVAAKGAQYVIFYNNAPAGASAVSGSTVSGIKAVAMVQADQGAAWIEALSAGENVTVAMTDPETAAKFLVSSVSLRPLPRRTKQVSILTRQKTIQENTLTGGYLSTYTSWGPTYEVDFKPQLAAPGGSILSTYPTALGSYAVLSGTSMSCPLVAGIYALVMTVRGTKDPRTLETVLSATANPTLFNDGTATYPVLAPAVQQGAGLVQAYEAAHAKTLLSVTSLSFNDSDHFVAEANFTLSNTGNASVLYRLSHVGAATGLTLPPGNTSIFPAAFPNELYDDYATLVFVDGDSVTVPAGGEATVFVAVTPPAGLDAARLPVYSGYVAINGSDGSSLSLPYVGVAGSLKSATVLSTEGTFLTSSLAVAAEAVAPGHAFLLPPPGHSNDTQYNSNSSRTDFPELLVSLALGSALVRVDVVPVSPSSSAGCRESLGLTTVGDVFATPLEYLPRNDPALPNVVKWDGRLASGAYAPEGSYKLVVRALKIFGDRAAAEDYELAETVEFGIRYQNSTVQAAKLRRAV